MRTKKYKKTSSQTLAFYWSLIKFNVIRIVTTIIETVFQPAFQLLPLLAGGTKKNVNKKKKKKNVLFMK